jgi:hypothetical protein
LGKSHFSSVSRWDTRSWAAMTPIHTLPITHTLTPPTCRALIPIPSNLAALSAGANPPPGLPLNAELSGNQQATDTVVQRFPRCERPRPLPSRPGFLCRQQQCRPIRHAFLSPPESTSASLSPWRAVPDCASLHWAAAGCPPARAVAPACDSRSRSLSAAGYRPCPGPSGGRPRRFLVDAAGALLLPD